MTTEQRRLHADDAAAATRVDVRVVRHYAALGLLRPSTEGYSDGDLAELRRVRRLRDELGLDHPAIEIVLRMRRRIQALQAEIRRLESTLPAAPGRRGRQDWVEAEWEELS
jgi:DNA-binding transcriptional MerR regulator